MWVKKVRCWRDVGRTYIMGLRGSRCPGQVDDRTYRVTGLWRSRCPTRWVAGYTERDYDTLMIQLTEWIYQVLDFLDTWVEEKTRDQLLPILDESPRPTAESAVVMFEILTQLYECSWNGRNFHDDLVKELYWSDWLNYLINEWMISLLNNWMNEWLNDSMSNKLKESKIFIKSLIKWWLITWLTE